MHKSGSGLYGAVMLLMLAGARALAQDASLASDTYASGPNMDRDLLPTPIKTPAWSDEAAPAPAEAALPEARRVHLLAGVDVTSAYYSRGLRQEDRGVMWQPYATVGVDVYRDAEVTISPYAGTWNSVHDRATGAATDDSTLERWYEADAYFGVNAELGRWTLGAQYGWFLSPSDAFTTVEELQFTATFDDADALGSWSLQPTVALIIETGDGSSDGLEKGGYLQLGVTPGIDLGVRDDGTSLLRLDVPVMVGLSAWDYYQRADGEDELFGYASVGVRVSYEVPLDDSWGTWSVYASATGAVLGDMASDVNDGEDSVGIFSGGVSVEY